MSHQSDLVRPLSETIRPLVESLGFDLVRVKITGGRKKTVQIMAERNRPSSVYVSPLRKFVTIRTAVDAANLSRDMKIEPDAVEDLFSDSWRMTAEAGKGWGDS